MLSRRTVLRCAPAISAATLPSLSGCGQPDGGALTFLFQAAPGEARARMRIIDEFARRHPDIKVRTVVSGPDPQQQILTYCAGGKCPDVLMTWESYPQLAELGILLDLGPLIDQQSGYAAELRADSISGLLQTFRFRGTQYALPEQWAGVFLYYNKKHFAAAGIPLPPREWQHGWTFAEFLAAAQALTRRDSSGRAIQWGFVDAWPPRRYSASLFGMNNGSEWFTPPIDPHRTNIDDPNYMAGFQFYADLSLRHRVAPGPAGHEAASAIDLFAQGKAAMALTGHWMYSTFAGTPGLDFDVTVLPVGPAGRQARSDIGTTGLAIAATSPRKEQAWQFVRFATGPVGQRLIAASGLFVPALTSARRSPEFRSAHQQISNIDVLIDGPQYSVPLPVTPHWSRVDATFRRASDRVLRGAATAEWFRHGTAAEVNALLRGEP